MSLHTPLLLDSTYNSAFLQLPNERLGNNGPSISHDLFHREFHMCRKDRASYVVKKTSVNIVPLSSGTICAKLPDMASVKHPSRKTFLSRHHMIPKSRGGTYAKRNMLLLWRDRHNFWHQLFADRTFEEILVSLQSEPMLYFSKSKIWLQVFKTKTPDQAIEILQRIQQIKKSL